MTINVIDRHDGASDSFTLYQATYTSGGDGSISGDTEQFILAGENATAIQASPDAGFIFDEWSDGVIDAERIDTNVQSNINVVAQFVRPPFYDVTYNASTGGSIAGGAHQQVPPFNDASMVIAEPDTGYYFVQWSDGVMDVERTDVNLLDHLTVTAQFGIITELHNLESTPNTTTAYITWNTNIPNSTQIAYGLTPNLLNETLETNTSPRVENHEITLTNLSACSRYYYQVTNRDMYETATTSAMQTFITDGCDLASLDGIGSEETIHNTTGGFVELEIPRAHARLDIPQGFANQPASFQINTVEVLHDLSIPNGKELVGDSVFNLTAFNELTGSPIATFDEAITFTVYYDDDITAGLAIPSFIVARYNQAEELWEDILCENNPDEQEIICQLDTFSTYALLGDPIPQRRRSSGSTVDSRVRVLASLGSTDNAYTIAQQFGRDDLIAELGLTPSSSVTMIDSVNISPTPLQLDDSHSEEYLNTPSEEIEMSYKETTQTHNPSDDLVCTPFIRRGDRSEKVREIQRRLGGIAVDSIFGPETERAVRAFQTRKEILVDGIVGPQTCGHLTA